MDVLSAIATVSAQEPVESKRVDALSPVPAFGQQSYFDISFQSDASGIVQAVWVASAKGLYRYDGYHWRRFGVQDGLPSDFVRCVLITRNGTLWIGTDKGAGVFDGKSFDPSGAAGQLAGPNVRRIIEDREGALWFTSDSWPSGQVRGGITRLRAGVWQRWRKEQGLPSDYVVSQYSDSAGRKFALTLNGPARLGPDNRWIPEPVPALPPGVHWGSSVMSESVSTGVLLSNGDQVFALRDEKWAKLGAPPRHQHGMTVTRDGRIVIAGDTALARKAFFEWTGTAWKQASEDFSVPHTYGEELRQSPDGSLWYLAFECLVRWQGSAGPWQTLPPAPGFLIQDRSQTIWALRNAEHGSPLRALFELQGEKWKPRGMYQNFAIDRKAGLWVATNVQIQHLSGSTVTSWTSGDVGVASVLNVSVSGDGTPWVIGRDHRRLGMVAFYDGASWQSRMVPELGKPETGWRVGSHDAGIWCIVRDAETQRLSLLKIRRDSQETFPLPSHALSNFANDMAVGPSGELWLFGDSGAHRLGADRTWRAIAQLPARRVSSVAFLGSDTWLLLDSALGGKGGFVRLTGDDREFFEADSTGGQFQKTLDGALLAGGHGSLFVIPPPGGAGPPARPQEIRIPGGESVLSALKDKAGAYWIGTPSALLQFRPDRLLPETELISPSDRVLSGEPFVFSAVGWERFKPRAPNPSMSFSWNLDGGGWSPFSRSSTFTIPPARLGLGPHRVSVRARDNGMDVDATPSELTFHVHSLPIQEQPWFLPALLTLVGLLGFSTTVALLAKRKLAIQAMDLETRVQERTASLVNEVARRGQVEQDLRASEEQHRQIVSAAQEGIATFDADGRCTLANNEFANIVGKTADSILGKRLEELLSPASIGSDTEVLAATRPGVGSTVRDIALVHEDESIRHVSVCTQPGFNEGGKIRSTLVTMIDMTSRRNEENAIRRSEAYYRLLFENNPNPMFVLDLEQLSFLSVNKAAVNVYGYSREEFQNITILDLQLPERVEMARKKLRLEFPTTATWPWRHRCKDGTVIDTEITAQDMEFQGRRARLAMTVDTTQRNRALAALRESEASLAQAQKIAKIGSFQLNLQFHPPACKWSDEVLRIFGVEQNPGLLTASTFFSFVHPDDVGAVRAARNRAIRLGQSVELEHRIVRRDSSVRHLRSTAVMSATPEGQTLVGTFQDVTEYKALEEQLRQSQKLESIGRLAGGVAHDFNNLLTVINGYSSRILKRLEPTDRLYDEASHVVEAGKEAASLTRQLLTFSRKQVFKPLALDLNDAILRSRDLLSRMMGEDVELCTLLSPRPVMILADPVQLQQVLMNLAVNARDAMPNGGTLTIRTDHVSLDERFAAAHPGTSVGPGVLLEVTDTGAGMSEEVQRRIFEPFFTTKERTGGTGLGLSTVYGIIQQSGGAIAVRSQPGQGASFRIYLSLLASAVGHESRSDLPAGDGANGTPGQGAILLVEDQRDVRRFIASALRSAGYDVAEAANGSDALAYAHAAEIDLLLTDVIMPGMNGKELAMALQERRKGSDPLPVLYMSGYSEGVISRGGVLLDGAMLLEKPFTLDVLLRKVGSLIAQTGRERRASKASAHFELPW